MRPQIGIRQLRDNLTATIRRVRGGESIEVTHDGRPVAVLSPLPSGRIARLVAAGEITEGELLEEPLRRFPVTGKMTATAAIEADRSGR